MPAIAPSWRAMPIRAEVNDFDTDQAGFEEWVGKWRLAGKDRGEGPRTVVTWHHAAGRRAEVLIQDGVGCGWWEGDAGWFIAVAFPPFP